MDEIVNPYIIATSLSVRGTLAHVGNPQVFCEDRLATTDLQDAL